MRLQVEIRRHTLPSVNIIYNTSTSISSVKTISELLAAVDKIVPLESTDGEWGLEDYIVEVAATADQHHLYECLHYQLIRHCFKEDDEVVIRGLTSDEIRERRQGGRLQILPDGRHLFDGVAWGRRYNTQAHRPGIVIPPRKKRRLLPPEDSQQQEEVLQLEYVSSDAQIGTILDSNDEEEDDEYEDEGDSSEEEDGEDESQDEVEEKSTQIITKQDFDDADVNTDAEDDDEDSTSQDERASNIQDDEVQLLLKEAGEIEQAYNSLPLEFRVTSPKAKRKRSEFEEASQNGTNPPFEGFSSPDQKRTAASVGSASSESQIQGMIGEHVVTEPNGDHSMSAIRSATATLGKSEPKGQAGSLRTKKNGRLPQTDLQDGSDSEDVTSSSGASSSDSSSESEESEHSSNSSDSSDSSNSSDLSNSSSDSDQSDSDDTSSSGESSSESESDSESEVEAVPVVKTRTPAAAKPPQNLDSEPTTNSAPNNPPGSGTKRTRTNNERNKRRKRLEHLKEQGLLPPEADFDALRAYEASNDSTAEQVDSPSLSLDLVQRKEEMLARLNAVYDQHGNVADTKVGEESGSAVEGGQAQLRAPIEDDTKQAEHDTPKAAESKPTTSEVPQKRRLDIASTRRMLFSSLGLRNPKTPEAEQALREKLSKPVREIRSRHTETEGTKPKDSAADDSWKKKLIISAIECVQEGLVLSPPPFPFKQRWERETSNKKARLTEQYNSQEDNANDLTTTTHKLVTQSQPDNSKTSANSDTTSASASELDDLAQFINWDTLPDLMHSDVQIDAIIAYKQLQLNSKFEPEPSAYRVARIVKIEGDLIDLLLATRYRDHPNPASLDSETGKRTLNKFEMPLDDMQIEDDGLRESTFEDMIAPKLIKPARIRVSNDEQVSISQAMNTSSIEDPTMIPESAPSALPVDDTVHVEVEVNAPRMKEITNLIDNAGFSTALDEQLLQPIDMPETHSVSGSLPSHLSESNSRQRAQNSKFEPDTGDADNLQPDPSSPPSVSMVETVDYPHVSQIDVNQSSLIDPAASSSYQDAQRVSPDVSDIEHTDLTALQVKTSKGVSCENSRASSLASEVPPSQNNGLGINDEAGDGNETGSNGGVQLRGGDADPGFDAEFEDLDSDALPSLRFLTSSQKDRSSRKKQSRVSGKISPPPLRKTRSSLSTSNVSPVESVSPGPSIKISASQKPSLSMSQIDQDNSIVDLTVSSDPVEPDDADDDDYGGSRRGRKNTRNSKIEGSSADTQGVARTMRSAFAGLGSKKSLTGKARSRV